MDEAALAPDMPAVGEYGIACLFPHGVAAEQHRLDGCQRRARGEIDVERARQLACGKEDGFLRQPVEMGAGADGDAAFHMGGRPGRAIAALAGLGGENQSPPAATSASQRR